MVYIQKKKDILWGGATASSQYEGGYDLDGKGLDTQDCGANKTQSASAHDKPTDLDPTAQHITLISFCLADSFTAFTNLFVVTPDTQHNKILYILYYLTF